MGFVRRTAGRRRSGGALLVVQHQGVPLLVAGGFPRRRLPRVRPGDPRVAGALVAAAGEQAIHIPMRDASTRSLNLATAVAIVLYEAARQHALPAGTGPAGLA